MNDAGGQISGVQERTEVTLHVSNDLSILAKLFASLSEELQYIDAWRFYTHHERAAILIITKMESRVPAVLRAAGFTCETGLVLVLEEACRRVSALRLSAELRASGMHVLDAYTCSSSHNGTMLVFKTADCSQATDVTDTIHVEHAGPLGVNVPEDEVETVHPVA